jgi:hypothetical protein
MAPETISTRKSQREASSRTLKSEAKGSENNLSAISIIVSDIESKLTG